VSRDYYAVLGVSPTSEDVVISAAYRALMRRYHPDADPSSEAAQRAQAINAAYAVLGDPEKRARYDGSLAAQGLIRPDTEHRVGLARRMVLGPAAMIGLVALAATATLIAFSPPLGVLPKDGLPLSPEPRPDRSLQIQPISGPGEKKPADDVSAATPPKAISATKEVPNAMLEPAEEVIAPEVPRVPAVRPAPSEPSRHKPPASTATPKRVAGKPTVALHDEKPVAVATDTKMDCRLGNGWADRTICGSSNLSALDRQNGLLYAQSLAKADQAKRSALVGSRDRFQAKRDACRSENCLTSAYIARLREISDIMARGSQQ